MEQATGRSPLGSVSLELPDYSVRLGALLCVTVLIGAYIASVALDSAGLYFIILLGLVVLGTALIRFESALLFVPITITNPYVLKETGTNMSLSEYVLLILYIVWFIRLIPSRERLHYPKAFALPVILIIGTGVLSLAAAHYPGTSALQDIRYIEVLGVLFFVIVNECRTEKQIKSMVFFLMIGGLIASLIGIGQFIFFAGTMGEVHRVSGLLGGAFGGVAGTTVCLAFGMLLFDPSRGKKTFAVVVLGIALTALIMSQTRAWIGGAAIGLLTVMLLGRAKAARSLILLACAGSFVIYIFTQTGVFGASGSGALRGALSKAFRYESPAGGVSVGDLALYERLIVWRKAVSLTAQNPLFGIGAGNLRFDDYLRAHLTAPVQSAGYVDNQYLNFFAEAGLLAGIAWLAYMFVSVRAGLRGLRNSAGTALHADAYGLFPSLLLFVVGSVFWVVTAQHDYFAVVVVQIALLYNVSRGVPAADPAGAG